MAEDILTQQIEINVGPQHPSTHGVYRGLVTLEGEKVVKLENIIGYLHRGIEKIAEYRTYHQFLPYTDRLDYLSAMLNNLGYVQAVEKLAGITVPERAEYIRVIVSELQRIASHLVFVASFALDLGATTGWMYCFREREKILDLFEMVCGSRLTTSYMRIGGVAEDLPSEFVPETKKFISEFPASLEEYDTLITGNEIFQARCRGVGILSIEELLSYGVTGPNLRAAGFKFDLRKNAPYGVYDRFDFEVPIGETGDAFDRYRMRMLEMYQSIRIIEQAVEGLPEGEIQAKVPRNLKPAGEVYHQIESSKGILGYYIVGRGEKSPYRLHIHGPSFVNLGAFPQMVKGGLVQDLVTNIASIDIVLGEVDR